jgi:hypothetical protein
MDYQEPRIEDLGELREITAGQLSGEATDAEFPVHTPLKALTFS